MSRENEIKSGIDIGIRFSLKKKPPTANKRGFTLLEIILSVSILALLVSVIFSIMSSSIGLSSIVIQEQENTRTLAAQSAYLKEVLESIPSQAKVALEENEHQLQKLTIHYPSTTFPSGGQLHFAEQLILEVLPQSEGKVQLHLLLSNQDPEFAEVDSLKNPKELKIIIFDNYNHLEWRVYSTLDQEWLTEWDLQSQKPNQIQLHQKLYLYEASTFQHFWVP